MLCYGVVQQDSSSSAIIRKTDDRGVRGRRSDSSTGQRVRSGKRREINRERPRGLGRDQRGPEKSLLLLQCLIEGVREMTGLGAGSGVSQKRRHRALPTCLPLLAAPQHTL